jgi:hypothetical protein
MKHLRALLVASTSLTVTAALAVLADPRTLAEAAAGPDRALAATAPDALLGDLAGLLAWAGGTALLLGVAAAAAATLPGRLGRLADRVAGALTPRLLRRLVRTAVTVTVVAGPLAAALPATAATAPSGARGAVAGPSFPPPAGPADLPAGGEVPLPEIAPPRGAVPDLLAPDPPPDPAPPPAAAPDLLAPTETPLLPTTVTAAAPPEAAGAVTVRPGDSLWQLAADRLGADATTAAVATAWPRWWQANRQVIGDDPDLLHAGQRLVPPAADNARGDAS